MSKSGMCKCNSVYDTKNGIASANERQISNTKTNRKRKRTIDDNPNTKIEEKETKQKQKQIRHSNSVYKMCVSLLSKMKR